MLLGELLFLWLQRNWKPLGRLQDFIGDFTRTLPRPGITTVFVAVVRVAVPSRVAVFRVAIFRVAVFVLVIGGFGIAILRAIVVAFLHVFLVRQKPDLNRRRNISRLGVGARGDHHQLRDIAVVAAR